MKKLTSYFIFFLFLFGLVTASFSYTQEDIQVLQRAAYHANELEKEISNSFVKDKDILLKKVRFIKERLKEEIMGNPSDIKTYKKIN